ncbi:MAG: lycopene cyclase domain-containing protein [Candidatus Pacebacteria bacterium]|nr:lycopene cyclase domain-containing protein [Candidatus Paceibacterota bacterium]
MFINLYCAYLLLSLALLSIWFIIFIISKKTRREQLIMSVIFLPLGTLYEILHFYDYWKPESIFSFRIGTINILLEDFIFSFAIIGIGSVIYELIFRKRLRKINKRGSPILNILYIILIDVIVLLSLFYSGVNSIIAVAVSAIALTIFILIQRKDLFANSLTTGLVMAILMFIIYFIGAHIVSNFDEILKQIWFFYGKPLGFKLMGVPLTELIWAFCFGLFCGPLYEFIKEMRTNR